MRQTLAHLSGITAAQAAIAFILKNSSVAGCIVGTTSVINLRELLGATDKRLLSEEQDAIWRTFYAQPITVSM
jgi:aryl-alcohol dehydrogenase-like predicted oxidoreductase